MIVQMKDRNDQCSEFDVQNNCENRFARVMCSSNDPNDKRIEEDEENNVLHERTSLCYFNVATAAYDD
jgi:hypothetical protein